MKYIPKKIYFAKCKNCGTAFEGTLGFSGQKKRKTCSRSCAVALSWKKPGVREAKMASLSKAQSTPKALARLAAHNARRWAKPDEHQKLSEQNRREWRHPERAKKRAAAIKKKNNSPEVLAKFRAAKRELWKNPIYRESNTKAVREALATPENRARASAALRRRWQDPIKRQKMLDGWKRMIGKKRAMQGRPLTEIELAVLDTLFLHCKNGVYLDDLRALCRDAGVSSTQIAKIVDSLIIQRKVIKMRRIPNALRVGGRGIAA